MSLLKKVIKGGKWTTLEAVFNAIIQIIRLYILTKLLSPTDFGLMAMAMVVMGFSQLFMDFGLSSAIIYKKDSTHKELSTLYWMNILMGLITLLIIFLGRNIIALHVFNEEKLATILGWFSLLFLTNSTATQYNALLRKQLKFDVLAKINISTALIGFIVTIVLAYTGSGVWALVYGFIIQSILSASLKVLIGRKIHQPLLYFNIKEVRYYLSFGGFQLGERLVSYLRQQGDNLLIGIFLSTETLGLYNVAKTLVRKPIIIINSVFAKMAFPVFTSIKKHEELVKWSITLFRVMNGLTLPIMGVFIILPEMVIYYMYGEQWLAAIPFLRLLGVLFSLRLLRSTFGPLILSKGKAKLSFMFNLVFSLVVIIVLFFTIQMSIITAIYGMIAVEILLMQLMTYKYIINDILKLSLLSYLKELANILIPYSAFLVIVTFLYKQYSSYNLVLQNLLFITVGGIIYLLVYYTLNKEVVTSSKQIFWKKK